MAAPQTSPTLAGSLRLFRFAGITVYVHWLWFLIAIYEVQARRNAYSSLTWNVAEYLTLFAIVLLHEFGHSLACRQVGGRANEIVLWPLGGIAFVNPPARPGAWLWSIAAGPLVNVALVPATLMARIVAESQGLAAVNPDADYFLLVVFYLNLVLLIFNMLPIYPLDGGQILHALLWFVLGRATSLMVASIVGIVGSLGLIALAIWWQNIWLAVLVALGISRCWMGIQQARLLARLEKAPRHEDAACPSCGAHPLAGAYWGCSNCRTLFDTFERRATCPGCGAKFLQTRCPECAQDHPIEEWFARRDPWMDDRDRSDQRVNEW